MAKTAGIHHEIDRELEEKAAAILKEFGLVATRAIRRRIKVKWGLPIILRLSNRTTRETLDGTDTGKPLFYCQGPYDLIQRLKL